MSSHVEINSDILEGKWNQLKGKLRQKWGELTDDDMERIAGKRDELVGVLQEKYGHAREEAERDVDEFLSSL
ncbi:MAG: CsbD family protein [Anaerolineales bacterium]|nr:CsbD family protein [Anaerolineales bacterium]MCA9976173.1 CsbD family protein [Anaerolineales bacterium]